MRVWLPRAVFSWVMAIAMIALVWARPANAELVTIDDGFDERVLGRSLELAYDPTGLATVDDVRAGRLPFTASTKDVPSFGFRSGSEWARVPLRDRRGAPGPLVVELGYPVTDRVEFLVVAGDRIVHRALAGRHVDPSTWDMSARLPAITLAACGACELFVRIDGAASRQLPLRLFSAPAYDKHRNRDSAAQYLYFGALLVMTLYNAMLWVATRSRAYGLYVGFLCAFAVFQFVFSGLAVTDLGVFGPRVDFLMPEALAVAVPFGLWFANSLLDVPSWSRRVAAIVDASGYVVLAGVNLALLSGYGVAIRVALAFGVAMSLVLVALGAAAMRAGVRAAKLYLVAWGAIIAGAVVAGLRALGLVPTNAVTSHVTQLGSAIEFVLLSLALADRIKELQRAATRSAELAAASARAAEEASLFALAEQERSNAELVRLAKLKDEFLANTSHELRTPLNGIVGMAESLAGNVTLDPRAHGAAYAILDASRRLGALIGDLLDFGAIGGTSAAGLESGAGGTEGATVLADLDLGFVVAAEVAALAPGLIAKPVRLEATVPRGELTVRADEVRLAKVLRALLSNAVKFTEAGVVRVRARSEGEHVELVVEDEGCGIPANRLASVFSAFEQGDGGAARKHGGTGLGLALAKKNVALMGGTIEIRSTEGVGTVALVRLPRGDRALVQETVAEPASAPALPLLPQLPVPPGVRPLLPVTPEGPARSPSGALPKVSLLPAARPQDGRRARILVVDDDEMNRMVIAEHLSAQPYDLVYAEDGAQALESVTRAGPFDAVVLDVMMPGLTGYDVCRRLRQHVGPTDLPVLLVTAKAQASDLAEGFSSGANDFLHKPVSRLELQARLSSHLAIARASVAMRRFVPQESVRLLGHEDLTAVALGDAVETRLTIAFSDIRGFTTKAEALSAAETFEWLNACYAKLGPEVRAHGGFIDKYIGDGSLALFPGDPIDAVRAAIAMHRALDELGEARMGTGLHLGPTMVGTLGEPERFEATVLSDAVNVASRIEGATKFFGARVLVSREVAEAGAATTAELRRLGRVRLKGRARPVELFEVLDADAADDREAKRESLETFARAVAAFESGALHEALLFMHGIRDANPNDGPATAYCVHLAQMIDADETAEDGVFVLREK